MANLTITAGNVVRGANSSVMAGVAGATITAGMPVYLDTADRRLKIGSDASLVASQVVGIALHGASAGQPLKVITAGALNIGATLVVGTIYVLSTTGTVAPVADLLSGDFVTVLGVATTTSNLNVNIQSAGVAI